MPDLPQKASKITVSRGASASELGRAAFASCLAQIRGNERGARAAQDPEFTHQLRVGVRRLRLWLRLFSELLGEQQARTLGTELKWLFRRLGPVRELDVLLSEVIAPELESEPSRELAELARVLKRARERRARALRRTFESPRYRRLLRSLRSLSIVLEQPQGAPPARKWARRRLKRRLEAVLGSREAIAERDVAQRHELRKQLKKLRYSAELIGALWSPKRVRRYLEPVNALQDVLGAMNDAASAGTLIREAASKLESGAARKAQVRAQALDAAAEARSAELARLFAALEQSAPFWR